MSQLVECVPNFSEGRRPDIVARIAAAIAKVDTACIPFVASPEQIVSAAFNAVSTASQLIDMTTHRGEHPRLGATDVLPFVPVKGVTIEECVALAHEAGRRIASELSIPVYFYERAALRSNRVNLEDVRRGALELLREQITTNPERAPDVGPAEVHDTAGAIAVGARPFLIAFNVVLRSTDIQVARQVAKAIRARSGGLPFLKALGFQLHTRSLVQVSMNLVNYEATGMTEAYRAVQGEAAKVGVEIANAEIVGLVPRNALDRDAEYFPKLEKFSEAKILENQIEACSETDQPQGAKGPESLEEFTS
ncbi:MAG: glutamate formimidoyltransferase [Acidobacteria bacterium]|nr:MAG: glutamate formimidoyltransferase [Acidobacteriota bacterium]